VHVQRGLRDIVIEVCQLSTPAIFGTQMCSWGQKTVKSSATVKNDKRPKRTITVDSAMEAEFSGALVAKTGHAINIEVGDAMKIELTKDLPIAGSL
jgi:hypothetical protein